MVYTKLERGNHIKKVYTCTDQINDNIVYMLIHPKGYIVIFFLHLLNHSPVCTIPLFRTSGSDFP